MYFKCILKDKINDVLLEREEKVNASNGYPLPPPAHTLHTTHAVRSEYPAVPLPHEYVRTVDEAVRYAHVAHALLAVLELLEELEVAGGDDDLAGG